MLTLQPYEYFTIFRQLDNHSDPNRDSYYIRAVIRNARTSELLATVDLESKGEGEYSKAWQVPADPAGMGLWVKIITTVYSDSGYSTKATDYGQEGDTYLIDDRRKVHVGGADVDYKKIRAMVDDSVSKIVFPVTPTPALDLNPVLGEIARLYTALEAIPRYKDSAEELSSIREAVSRLSALIEGQKQEEKAPDFSPITTKLEELSSKLDLMTRSFASGLDSLAAMASENRDGLLEAINSSAADLREKLDEESMESDDDLVEVGSDYRGRVLKIKKDRL